MKAWKSENGFNHKTEPVTFEVWRYFLLSYQLNKENRVIIMNIAVDSQWNIDANNFATDNTDYEKAFESYISDDAEDDGEFWSK